MGVDFNWRNCRVDVKQFQISMSSDSKVKAVARKQKRSQIKQRQGLLLRPEVSWSWWWFVVKMGSTRRNLSSRDHEVVTSRVDEAFGTRRWRALIPTQGDYPRPSEHYLLYTGTRKVTYVVGHFLTWNEDDLGSLQAVPFADVWPKGLLTVTVFS
ncbi:hypothetical protein CC1G_14482 [Coprinopsis cinerea okayama7|uniref:Uncharacterized protein n=1 Tax=Coprinopsis cinerea (strain Okayama-7 / 130 / ATCC MYA-4618 / FGSC 9003) TaxID=240176 RepID=D6RMD7_COPC7|nr:hypothetical protein CC1G_14482 [Coprinopsis cinerea okayama7\|eukprot:XP_002911484.1 hypothetical protein CC1G_14482 [Coprinopsis cinerea okayama7\